MTQRIQQRELETQNVNPNTTLQEKYDTNVHIEFCYLGNIPICVCVECVTSGGYGEEQSRLGGLPERAGSAKRGGGWGAC